MVDSDDTIYHPLSTIYFRRGVYFAAAADFMASLSSTFTVLPASTVIFWRALPVPLRLAATLYSPTGTFSSVALPSLSVVP